MSSFVSEKLAFGFVIALVAALASCKPTDPSLPCDRPVQLYGGETVQGKGVRGATFEDRTRTFFQRVCGSAVAFETFAEENGRMAAHIDEILAGIAARPRSITFIHFPAGDIASGTSVDAMLGLYRRIIEQCAIHDAICIIGGQQPVNAFDQETTDRQLELEGRASDAFGSNYLPLYRYLQSESRGRRLIRRLDSGDGRLVDEFGHDLLFTLYRNRLLRLARSAP